MMINRFKEPAVLLLISVWASVVWAAPFDPSAADYTGHKGTTIHVSKLGDNSDGSSWDKAFHTIQAGLLAVPDNNGGHRVIIRPDTYVEANLYTGHPGAKGSYNLLIGDGDGKLGSGAAGWVIVDTSCPGVAVRVDTSLAHKFGNPPFKIVESDQPESGLKSVDWWGPTRCAPEYSTDDWDRWILRNLYATGSEGGFGLAMTDREGAELSWLMENCVGIGRFVGTCACGHVSRPDEPVMFRRCYFANLDWWGDAAGSTFAPITRPCPIIPTRFSRIAPSCRRTMHCSARIPISTCTPA